MRRLFRWLRRIWLALSIVWIGLVGALTWWTSRPEIRDGDWSWAPAALVLALAPPALLFLFVWGPAFLIRHELGLDKTAGSKQLGDAVMNTSKGRRLSPMMHVGGALALAGAIAGVHYMLCHRGISLACPDTLYAGVDKFFEPVWRPFRRHVALLTYLSPGLIVIIIARVRQYAAARRGE